MPLRLFSVSNTAVENAFTTERKHGCTVTMRHKAENHRGTIFCHSPSEHFSLKEKKKNNQLQNLILKKEKKKKTSPLSQLFHPLHVLNTHVVPDSWKKKRPPGWSHVKDLRRKNCFKRKKRIKCLNLWRVRRERKKGTQGKKQRKKKRGCLSSWMALWYWNRGPVTFSSQPLSCLGASWHPSELKQLSGLQVSLKPRP